MNILINIGWCVDTEWLSLYNRMDNAYDLKYKIRIEDDVSQILLDLYTHLKRIT